MTFMIQGIQEKETCVIPTKSAKQSDFRLYLYVESLRICIKQRN